MTRVIHTGDTHLGYRQYHSPERRADFRRAFEQVVDDAIAADVDAVIHAGDLFHDRRPDLDALHGTISILSKLRDADVPFLAIVGNHEGTRGRQWLDLFEMLGLATRLGDDPVRVGETAFYGLDHVAKSKRGDLDYEFAPHDADHAALVSHGLFQPFDLGDWDAEEVLTESNRDFDAMLLGDNHKPGKKRVADAWVTYCGSTERCSSDEREDRGYNIVEFDGEVAISRRGLDATREFAFVEADLGEGEGIDRVREALREHDLDDEVAIVEITGEGEQVTPARVEEFALEQGALVARVKDRREADDEEEDVDVSFADPDEAVRERVRDLGLSEAARGIDGTVRESKIADANVRESVQGRVSDLIEDGDRSAFEPAPDDAEPLHVDDATADGATADSGTSDDATADGEMSGDAATDDAAESTADSEATESTATTEAVADAATADDATGNDAAADDATAAEAAADDATADGSTETTETTDSSDKTLEEYL
ncbi:DNA double-strand break repair protein Mre11 [Halorussus litoreus]|uniref:DNA double-strand break repair protein Mre11 n=1 Tax=Halorussus litoreus TaxID=1710536 RepID=UPI000E22AD5A|nr:DNA double-strand break repair protein Mre11 [Halorussus litoreus]